MSVMSERNHCPRCGRPIPAEAPQGLCPKCVLMQAAIPTEAGQGAAAKSAPPTQEELAAAFPQLEILGLIGQGGMGFVFKARQPKLDRLVALKILPASLAAEPAFAERFTREGRVLARLSHPNIVAIHDFGHANGFFYLLMEFVDGVNLRQAMKAGRFTAAQALAIVPNICGALQFAHNEGILHRDIKPENILLDTKGRVKIADFGIAKLVGAGVQALTPALSHPMGEGGAPAPGQGTAQQVNLTEAGEALGTPQYMAPEQLEHPQDVDQRADIYSLGVVFYEMLTGELPVGRFAPPSEISAVDPRVDEVVLRTLEKERERRTQTAGEVKTQVETIAGSPAVQGATKVSSDASSLHAPTRFWARRAVWVTGVAALVLLAGVAALRISNRAPAPPDAQVKQGPREVLCDLIRLEVGRQLREAGATYDDLQVTVAVDRDSGTPFRVRYQGLQNFKAPDGTAPTGDGEFIMEYIGAGQWQGTLGGKQFTVLAGSRDNIDLPFVNDPQVIGQWDSVDFVANPADFNPSKRSWQDKLFLTGLSFLEGGKTPQPGRTWTKGTLINEMDKTASHYEIHELNGKLYLFFEWKSGDVTLLGMKPNYYVLRKQL
jgi:serine/threonine protein kinase